MRSWKLPRKQLLRRLIFSPGTTPQAVDENKITKQMYILKHNHIGSDTVLKIHYLSLPWRCAGGRLLPCPRPRPRWCTRSPSGRCGWGGPGRGWSAAAAGTDNTTQLELCKRLIGEVVQSRRRPLPLSHLRHYANQPARPLWPLRHGPNFTLRDRGVNARLA